MRILLALIALALPAAAAERFTGWQSCASSGCHGGGKGDDQVLTWRKLDPHSRAYGILISERSKRMAEALGIPDAAKSTQCTVCHSPMTSAAPEKLAPILERPNQGVSCESCHNPAESWLRFHTRPDLTHAHRVAAGLRDLDSAYQRANTCVGCHANLPSELAKAGHPTLRFELARQLADLPPHWQNFDVTQSGSSWLTSQAALLRELCWLAEKGNAQPERIDALHWLLRMTALGEEILPLESTASPGLRAAADRLAKSASASSWPRKKTAAQLEEFLEVAIKLQESPPAIAFRRAEVLVPALKALTLGLGPETSTRAKSTFPTLDLAIRSPSVFDAKMLADGIASLQKSLATEPASVR